MTLFGIRIGPYAWKTAWGPKYHPSMVISLAVLILSSLLLFGLWIMILLWRNFVCLYFHAFIVICQIHICKNNKFDTDEKVALDRASLVMVSEAAHLEGMTFDQAMERRKGYQYLYWSHSESSTWCLLGWSSGLYLYFIFQVIGSDLTLLPAVKNILTIYWSNAINAICLWHFAKHDPDSSSLNAMTVMLCHSHSDSMVWTLCPNTCMMTHLHKVNGLFVKKIHAL